jgi:hypothetical protein
MSECWAKAYSDKEPDCQVVVNLRAENERLRRELAQEQRRHDQTKQMFNQLVKQNR